MHGKQLLLACLITLSINESVIAQKFGCSDYWELQMDSSYLHDMSYPYIKSKRVFANSKNPHILVYFQGFYESLLYDVDTLNFELIDLPERRSKIIRIPVNETFGLHGTEPRYKVNDFTFCDNRLFLLVFNTIYVYELADSGECCFLHKYISANDHFFQWITMKNRSEGILVNLSNSSGKPNEIMVYKCMFSKNHIVIGDSLSITFDGKPFIQTEASYFSESDNDIFIGNATSSRITVISKSKFSFKDTFYHSGLISQSAVDTLRFENKMQFFSSVFSDSQQYHYQTSYVSKNLILRSRCQVPHKSIHYLDIYCLRNNQWDSVTTLIEGTYNYKKYKDSTTKYSLLHFDPMSSTKNYVLVDSVLYTIGFPYNVYKVESGSADYYYTFPLSELRKLGKELYESKDFIFSIYEYKIR